MQYSIPEDIVKSCKLRLAGLVNRGSEVCDNYTEGEMARCTSCGYSQYIHLCKQIVVNSLLLK